MKECSRCDQVKELDCFNKMPHCLFGVSNFCKTCQRELSKIHYEKNKDSYKKRAKVWAENNSVKVKSIKIKSAFKHRFEKNEKEKKYSKDKRLLNPDKERMKGRYYAHVRRTGIKAELVHFTIDEMRLVIESANGMCAYCGKITDELAIDHFIPISKNGAHELYNILPCCKSCNSSKGASDGYKWLVRRGYYKEFLGRLDRFKLFGIEILET